MTKFPITKTIENAKGGNLRSLARLVTFDPHWFYIDWVRDRVLNFYFRAGNRLDFNRQKLAKRLMSQKELSLAKALKEVDRKADVLAKWTFLEFGNLRDSFKILGEALCGAPRRFPNRRPKKDKRDSDRLAIIVKCYVIGRLLGLDHSAALDGLYENMKQIDAPDSAIDEFRQTKVSDYAKNISPLLGDREYFLKSLRRYGLVQ